MHKMKKVVRRGKDEELKRDLGEASLDAYSMRTTACHDCPKLGI